jgi:hypothetical protein
MSSGLGESVVGEQLKFKAVSFASPISQHSLSAYHDLSWQAPITPKLSVAL